MVKMTQTEALDALAEMGSHLIMAGEWANRIGEPFGVTFTEEHFGATGGKGPLNTCDGVDIHLIADRIRRSLGADSPGYHGRGSQFRADVQAARGAIKA